MRPWHNLPGALFCWILLLIFASCSDSDTSPTKADDPYLHYNALFEGKPPLSDSNLIVVASPREGDSYRIGDTLEVVLKMKEPASTWWAMGLSTDGGLSSTTVAEISGPAENPGIHHFGDTCIVGIQVLKDITVVKMRIPPEWGGVSTISSSCCIVVSSFVGYFVQRSDVFEIRS